MSWIYYYAVWCWNRDDDDAAHVEPVENDDTSTTDLVSGTAKKLTSYDAQSHPNPRKSWIPSERLYILLIANFADMNGNFQICTNFWFHLNLQHFTNAFCATTWTDTDQH